jgi:hypothetical protein
MKGKLIISASLWQDVIRELRIRGQGWHESGAFLLGNKNGEDRIVTSVAYYDNIDPKALETGICIVRGVGFSKLWQICRESRVDVLADVHTHGDRHPRQSWTDKENPMISEEGHVAIILPDFARFWGTGLSRAAAYEYVGNYTWNKLCCFGQHAAIKITKEQI